MRTPQMTQREEQRRRAAEKYHCYETAETVFLAGARWADENPQERVNSKDALWLARDKNGDLYLYQEQPVILPECSLKFTNVVTDLDSPLHAAPVKLNPDLFPEVTFDNSPQRLIIE